MELNQNLIKKNGVLPFPQQQFDFIPGEAIQLLKYVILPLDFFLLMYFSNILDCPTFVLLLEFSDFGGKNQIFGIFSDYQKIV